MEAPPPTVVFAEFALDEARRELRARGERVRLDPKPMSLLLFLVRHRDRVVSKHELLEELWPDAVVSESALSGALKRLRLALGDAGARPRLIQTLRGHGYRFVAPVRERRTEATKSSPAGAPFVGRSGTLEQLTSALDATQAGSGRMVLLAGEPGIGKTRVAEELARIARLRGVLVLNGWCYEGKGAPPFWPWVQILRALVESYPADRLSADLGSGVDTLSLILPELRERWPDLAPPVQAGRDELRFELFQSACSFLQRAAAEQPITLIVDDLHRADEPSLGLLAFLAHEIGHSAILVLGTYRDVGVDREHPLAETLGELARHTLFERIRLEGLAPDEVRELVGHLAGSGATPVPVEAILERTDGNPFFVTELVRFLAGSETAAQTEGRSAQSIDVPPAVREVILGRLARLSPSCNEALSVASVVGRDFALDTLVGAGDLDADAVDAAIDEGRRTGMVSDGPGGDPRFAHVLIQEAVYEALGRGRRARLHRRIAEWLEKTWPHTKLDEQAALLAHHWETAGDALEAARWHARAARWVNRSDMRQALGHWRQVRALSPATPKSSDSLGLALRACRGILEIGWRVGLSQEEAKTVFTDGRALAERSRDLRSLALLLVSYGLVREGAGDPRAYRMYAEEAAALAERSGDPGLRLHVSLSLADSATSCGLLREGLCELDRHFELAGSLGRRPSYVVMELRHRLLGQLGRLAEALEQANRLVEFGRERSTKVLLSLGYIGQAEIKALIGDAEGSLADARAAIRGLEHLGTAAYLSMAYAALGTAQIQLENWDDALEAIERSLSISRSSRTHGYARAQMITCLAEAHLGRGEDQRAGELAAEAVALARRQGARSCECRALITLARTLLVRGGLANVDAIRSTLDRARELAEEMGARPWEARVREEYARLCHLGADGAEAERHLREAHRLYAEMGATGHAERLARELEELV